jgi:hypothetical protein
MRSCASNRKEKIPGGRGEDVEAHQGLEGVGAAPEEEIGAAALRRRSVLRCGGAAVREEGKGAVWFGEGALCFLYRAERGAEGAR